MSGPANAPVRHGEATLRFLLSDMADALAHPATSEVVVNEPGRFGVEQDGFWTWHDAPALTFDRLMGIAVLAAHFGGKDVGGDRSRCVSTLPDGQRVKMVLPPTVRDGTVSLSIRRRAKSFTPTLEWLASTGYFDMLDPAVDWASYFAHDVLAGRPKGSTAEPRRKSIVICGEIGSSKTTAGEACLRALNPGLRLITIESSDEWQNLPSRNWKPLYYDDADPDGVTRCVQDALQMAADVMPIGELRGGGEAWGLYRALHSGVQCITTVHAASNRDAIDTIAAMVTQSPEGRALHPDHVQRQLRRHIGVVAHAAKFMPTRPDERKYYRLTEVVEVGSTAAEDRVVSKVAPVPAVPASRPRPRRAKRAPRETAP